MPETDKKLVNISIDDVSPHPYSSINVINKCFYLIEKFNDIKFTLFVPTAYWRTISPPEHVISKKPYILYEHPIFCEELKTLSKK